MNKMMLKYLHTCLLILSTIWFTSSFAQDVKKGQDLMVKERLNEAKAYFKNSITADPKNIALYTCYLGEVCYKQEKYDSARYYYMEAMKLDEKEPLCYAGMGKVSMGTNEVEGQKNFEKAISLAKKSATPYSVIASYYLYNASKKNADKAIALLQDGLKIDATNYYALILMGEAYLLKNDGSSAMSYFNKALDLKPNNPVAYWKKGNLYSNARNYDEGMKMFQEGLSHDADFGPIYHDMGELYYRAKQYKKAIEDYKLYLSKIDNNDDAQFRYASFLYLTQDYATALKIFDELELKNYKDLILYRLKGYCLYETGSYEKALESLNKFMTTADPKLFLTVDYEYLAKMYLKNNNDSLATLNIEIACLKDSSDYTLWTDLGNFYFLKNQYDNAVTSYNRKFEKLKPNDNDYLSIGKAYYFGKKYQEADLTFAHLTESRPTAYIGFLYRARSNAFLDKDYKTGQAKPFYEKVIELCATDEVKHKDPLLESYQYLGTYYLYKKEKVNADEYWNKVLKLDPANKRAHDALKVK